jgi:hypothetical protein
MATMVELVNEGAERLSTEFPELDERELRCLAAENLAQLCITGKTGRSAQFTGNAGNILLHPKQGTTAPGAAA